MSTTNPLDEAIELLQQLGLKEYEARCFVGLTRLSTGTAKQLSGITDVPRTRVYNAIRTLEAQGLVEIQHSSPQQFRAVPLAEATETLRDQYDDRIDQLATALENVDPVETGADRTTQEIWAMAGTEAIANRTHQLVDDAADEVILVLDDETLLTEDLTASLNAAAAGIDLLVGGATDRLRERIEAAVPDATAFVSGTEWLNHGGDDDVVIGRLMLVDRSTVLVSTLVTHTDEEHAVVGDGFENGLVVIARRLLVQGVLSTRDPVDSRVAAG